VVPFAWSTCFLIPRPLIAAEGLYDERFEAYDSDLDWCTRQAEKGRTIVFDPGVKVIHIGGASRTPEERRRRELEARRTYHRIHSGPLGGLAYEGILRLDSLLVAARRRRAQAGQ
jgi:GT2 family glycosyltransferase